MVLVAQAARAGVRRSARPVDQHGDAGVADVVRGDTSQYPQVKAAPAVSGEGEDHVLPPANVAADRVCRVAVQHFPIGGHAVVRSLALDINKQSL